MRCALKKTQALMGVMRPAGKMPHAHILNKGSQIALITHQYGSVCFHARRGTRRPLEVAFDGSVWW